jgi:hypothetical protein
MRSERMPKVVIHPAYLCGVHLGIVLFNVRILVVSEGDVCLQLWDLVRLLCSSHLGSTITQRLMEDRDHRPMINESTSRIIGHLCFT